ncbi:hypothetical protein EDD37DRAFT_158278 [Exophiala viscosa]|uniref:Uncharacterized protein n=1 Tax=Exophiala viscosa TaxID=2486360 RepID=A0AAN6DN11_9EURO|nr:hypothetical protein EDD36DRAFT_445993 [Exophiala viscosa]KAI1620531.1 hypothetical protein EDD37DRAFT_158278 [Exophiala viscosa]
MAVAQSFLNQSSTSSRVRLSLQTIFSHNLLHRSPKRSAGKMSSSSSSVKSSPSSSFSSFGQGARMAALDLNTTFGPSSATSSPHSYLRRQPSAIDVALEEERYADPVEMIGLGLLEPRPLAQSMPPSPMELVHDHMQSPVILDGIFEIMERS